MNAGTMSAVITAEPITVTAETPFKDIAELLPHLLDEHNRPLWTRLHTRRLARKVTARVAKDPMTSPAVTVDAATSTRSPAVQ